MWRVRIPALVIGICAMLGTSHGAEITDTRRQQLTHLLKHDCGACHGLKLTGGLGPALTPDVIRAVTTETLRQTILHGRAGTPMPPFAGLLSSGDIDWLIASLRAGGSGE